MQYNVSFSALTRTALIMLCLTGLTISATYAEEDVTDIAVSYTHLTLPTICSV